MNLLFLGTGAADSLSVEFPDDYRNKSLRRCACVLLNGRILLDCGPHALPSMAIAGIKPEQITDVIITHLHRDHFNLDTLKTLAAARERMLNVWHNEAEELPPVDNCAFHPMTLFTPYEGVGFTLHGLTANHSIRATHYAIEMGDKRLLYALDGAWMTYATEQYTKGWRFDAAVLDATVGDYVGDYRMGEHNSIPMIRLMVPSMVTLNILKPDSAVVLNHMAYSLHKTHEETCELVKKDGFIVTHDGLELEI